MLKEIKKGLIIGITAGISMMLIVVTYAAWAGLYAESGDSLTVAKWNELVARTEPIEFYCEYNNSGINGWNSITWNTSLCGGTYQPQDFIYCNYSAARVDGVAMQRGLFRLDSKSDAKVFASSTSSVILGVKYMCWN